MSHIEGPFRLIEFDTRTPDNIREEIVGATGGLMQELEDIKEMLKSTNVKHGILVNAYRVFAHKTFIDDCNDKLATFSRGKSSPIYKSNSKVLFPFPLHIPPNEKITHIFQNVKAPDKENLNKVIQSGKRLFNIFSST